MFTFSLRLKWEESVSQLPFSFAQDSNSYTSTCKYIALIMYTWCQHVCECLTLQRPSLLAFHEHSQQVYKLIVTPTCDSCRSFFLNVDCKKFLFYKNENDCNYKLPNTLTFLTHLLQLHILSLDSPLPII